MDTDENADAAAAKVRDTHTVHAVLLQTCQSSSLRHTNLHLICLFT